MAIKNFCVINLDFMLDDRTNGELKFENKTYSFLVVGSSIILYLKQLFCY